jgi:hypothetical protein
MTKVAVVIFWAVWFLGFYFLVRTLSKLDQRGRSRWRNLITPTPVDAFPAHGRTEKAASEATLPKV